MKFYFEGFMGFYYLLCYKEFNAVGIDLTTFLLQNQSEGQIIYIAQNIVVLGTDIIRQYVINLKQGLILGKLLSALMILNYR